MHWIRTFFRIEFPSNSIERPWYHNPNAKVDDFETVDILRMAAVNDRTDPEKSERYASARIVKVTETVEVVQEPLTRDWHPSDDEAPDQDMMGL